MYCCLGRGGVFSTIEKRFQLKTSELAPFLIVNDIVLTVMVLFVAHYGHTSHRPRLIGGGTVLVGLGFLLCTLPQFIYDTPPQFSLESVSTENDTADENLEPIVIYPVCIPLFLNFFFYTFFLIFDEKLW